MKNENLNLVERIQAPTPKWFKTLRAIGLALAAIGGAIVAAPVALPAGLVSVAGYLGLVGGVITAVSQTAVSTEEEPVKPVAPAEIKQSSCKKPCVKSPYNWGFFRIQPSYFICLPCFALCLLRGGNM